MLMVAWKPRLPGSWPHPEEASGLQQAEPEGVCSGGSAHHPIPVFHSMTPCMLCKLEGALHHGRTGVWPCSASYLQATHRLPRHQPSLLWNGDNNNCPLTSGLEAYFENQRENHVKLLWVLRRAVQIQRLWRSLAKFCFKFLELKFYLNKVYFKYMIIE